MRGARAKCKARGTTLHRLMPCNNDTLDTELGSLTLSARETWKSKKTYELADVAGLATAVIPQKDLAVKEKLLQGPYNAKAKVESGVM